MYFMRVFDVNSYNADAKLVMKPGVIPFNKNYELSKCISKGSCIIKAREFFKQAGDEGHRIKGFAIFKLDKAYYGKIHKSDLEYIYVFPEYSHWGIDIRGIDLEQPYRE